MDIVQTRPVSTVILIRRETTLLVRLTTDRLFILHNDRVMAQVMVVLQTRSITAHACSREMSVPSQSGQTATELTVIVLCISPELTDVG